MCGDGGENRIREGAVEMISESACHASVGPESGSREPSKASAEPAVHPAHLQWDKEKTGKFLEAP